MNSADIKLDMSNSSSKRKKNRLKKRRSVKLTEESNPKCESQLYGISHKDNNNFKKTPNRYTGCDVKLVPRIQQYMQTGDGSKGLVLDRVVDYLQQTFIEYKRKKKSSFKTAVSKAIDYVRDDDDDNMDSDDSETVLHEDESSLSLASIADSDYSTNNENYVVYEDTNSANNTLRAMYSKSSQHEIKMTPAFSSSSPNIHKTNNIENEMGEVNGATKKSNVKGGVKQKAIKPDILPRKSTVKFDTFGGIENIFEDLEDVFSQFINPEAHIKLGDVPRRGLLLHGPSGCGKTHLATAIAGELDWPFYKLNSTELVSGVSGESEKQIRELFETAIASEPCVLFLDQIDAIMSNRETTQREMDKRIVSQLLSSMDDLNQIDMSSARILLIGATNRPEALDPSFRQAGRFDTEICIKIPNAESRKMILDVLCKKCSLSPEVDLMEVANESPGYVGTNLRDLVSTVIRIAIKRMNNCKSLEKFNEQVSNDAQKELIANENNKTSTYSFENLNTNRRLTFEELNALHLEMSDFKTAMKRIQPLSKQEGFATVPDVNWDDIGALSSVRRQLKLSITAPIKRRKLFENLGLTTPAGILLWGPPGCGKTLLAKAIANESRLNFISVKGPELFNMYLGESEKAIRNVFQRAQNSSPCVIFFDEIDAICPRRSDNAENGASSRVVNQLLTEMDGISCRKDVYIVGATNRYDILDPAVLRPGRLDRHIYVGFPTPKERVDILTTITKGGTIPQLSPDVSLYDIGMDKRCTGFTGADLHDLVRIASQFSAEDILNDESNDEDNGIVQLVHLEKAFQCKRRSVSKEAEREYEVKSLSC